MPNEIIDSLEEQLGVRTLEEFSLYKGKIKLLYDDDAHKYYIDGPEGRFQVPNATTVLDTLDKSNALVPWAVRCAIDSLMESLRVKDAFDRNDVLSIKAGDLLTNLENARKAHRDNKNRAADIGKMAHKWLEAYGRLRMKGSSDERAYNLLGGDLPTDGKARSCIGAALAWIKEHHVVFMECERKVYSIEDNACGTFDAIAMVDGKRTLLDYKSSNGLYDTMRFQMAFYRSAYEEETGQNIEQSILLRLGKENGEFEPHYIKTDDEYRSDLMAFKGLLITYERVQELKIINAAAKAEAKAAAKAAKKKAA